MRAFVVLAALSLAATALGLVPPASAGRCAYLERTLEDAVGGSWQVTDAVVCPHPNDPYCGGHLRVDILGTPACVGALP